MPIDRRRPSALVAALALIVLLVAIPARAATIRVPSDEPTIASALIAAAPRDTVLVAPGLYHENIVWPEKQGIVLSGEAQADQTILDGSDTLSVIGIYGGIDSTTVIRRLTIQNGHAEGT